MRTPTGKHFSWAQFNIKADSNQQLRKVTRLNLRMADLNRVAIMEGTVDLLDDQGQVTESRNFTMPSVNDCVMAMNFGPDGMPAKSVKFTALRMKDNAPVFNAGFKMDLFIKE